MEHLELIEQHRFGIDRLYGTNWQINAPPLPLTASLHSEPEHALQRLLDEFAAEQIISPPQQAFAATIACHLVTRATDVLGKEQMKAIFEQLAETPDRHRCPHGRPTIVQISTLRLEQELRRR